MLKRGEKSTAVEQIHSTTQLGNVKFPRKLTFLIQEAKLTVTLLNLTGRMRKSGVVLSLFCASSVRDLSCASVLQKSRSALRATNFRIRLSHSFLNITHHGQA